MANRLVLRGLYTAIVVLSACPVVLAGDADGDGVPDERDVCNNTPPGIVVDYWGRPYADFDQDCDVDLDDFGFFQSQYTGVLSDCPTGQPCDDGIACTIDDVCMAGLCRGQPDDALCDDGQFCTGQEFCDVLLGCQNDGPVDCSFLDDDCNQGVCDEVDDACVLAPVNDGGPCDDGWFCTAGETCRDGACDSSRETDCTALDDQCNVGVCDEGIDSCVPEPINESGPCDDGLFCTVDERCAAGVCGDGGPFDCSNLDDQCNVGVCDEETDSCVPEPTNENDPCDDGLFCVADEICVAGACLGDAVDCSGWDDSCLVGVCNEDDDACEAQPVPDGQDCDDGSECSFADECVAGECVGIPFPDQMDCDDGDPQTDRSVCVDGVCVATELYQPSATIEYSCPPGGIFFAIALVEFADDGETLTVFGAPAAMTGPGGLGPESSFSVSGSITDGECTETYLLDGTFVDGTGFVGTFHAQFIGCGSCGWPSWPNLTWFLQ